MCIKNINNIKFNDQNFKICNHIKFFHEFYLIKEAFS